MDSLELTKQLVQLKTTADNTEELHHATDMVESFFSANNKLNIQKYEQGNKPSLVIGFDEGKTPDVLLMGHLDVVPAPDALYTPSEKDGRLLGRGVCDMKSEDAVMMLLMQEFAAREKPPSVALMLTTDEEIGGKNGAGYLINHVGYRPKVALVPDSGQAPDELVLWAKGILHFTLTAHGKAAHGSRPWLGQNAIEKLLSACQKLVAAFPSNTDPDHWYTTVNLGMVHGGLAVNSVPDEATCSVDIRYTPDMTSDVVIERVKHVCEGCEVHVLMAEPTSHTDEQHPSVKLYADLLQKQTGMKATFIKNHGGNDGRYLTALGIPTIVSRPLSGAQHSPDEWLDLASLASFHQLYRDYILAVSQELSQQKNG